jgi:AcrR family transcriptional regulator
MLATARREFPDNRGPMSVALRGKIRAMDRPGPGEDPRRRRTREDLLAAFFSLVLSRRYHEIRVADVLARAGVGRSTFYEHFRNKDALLAASLEGPFHVLTTLVTAAPEAGRVQAILEHFWENRALARSLFQGSALRVVRAALVAHVEAALGRDLRSRLRIPTRLAARALADGMFAPIDAWLCGEAKCSAHELALALQLSTAASARALQAGHALPHGQGDAP